ncbi:MAG: F0F1 ATP synthase subunit A [Planctomycetota bacterium]|jgi:F-type H+-transporting ATPase subunit a
MNPLPHVVDYVWWQEGGGSPFTTFTIISNHVIMMMIAAVVVLLLIPRLARTVAVGDGIEGMTPKGRRNALDAACSFLRDYVAKPNLGSYTDQYIHYIWSAFFFILTCNLVGILPLDGITRPITGSHGVYGTPTGNIWTTGALAICTLMMIVFNGLRNHGMAYIKHFFMGPFPINILIAVLEMVGLLAKTLALAIRLFANMVAGHILLAVLLGFIVLAGGVNAILGFGVAIMVVVGSVAFNMLEIFVAFLQAFIFAFLSCVFIGQAVNIGHHDEEHDDESEPVEAH